MMDALPVKILQDIFILTSLEERLECTLVCRSWYQLLNKRSLLYDICIKSDNMFNKFISMLQYLPDRASQVEILKLEMPRSSVTDCTFDKRIFCNLFTNLREFYSRNHTWVKPLQNHCDKPLELTNPNSKLELIIDERECELTRQLLKFGSCSRLKHLELDLICFDKLNSRNFYDPRKEIFYQLKNAPALKKLILLNCEIGIDDLEIVHKNVPALDTLEFKSVRIFTRGLPYNIIPATSVTTLKLDTNVKTDDPNNIEMYKYLAKKYINLKKIDYKDNVRHSWNPRHGWDPREMMKIYREGLLPLYKNAGQNLQWFDVKNFPTELNPFKTLDEFGVRVSRFNLRMNENRPIFEQLVGSNQPKYVESLNLYNTDITSPILLQNFTSLKTINISIQPSNYPGDVNLSDFFNAVPPTLTSFSASFENLDAKMDELPSHSNNIQCLRIRISTINPKIAEAISTCFPKLNELYLQGYVTENLILNLPSNHFIRVYIFVKNNDSLPHAFSITEGNSLNPRYYDTNSKGENLECGTAEEINNRVIISINFTSVDYLRCDGLFIETKRLYQ